MNFCHAQTKKTFALQNLSSDLVDGVRTNMAVARMKYIYFLEVSSLRLRRSNPSWAFACYSCDCPSSERNGKALSGEDFMSA